MLPHFGEHDAPEVPDVALLQHLLQQEPQILVCRRRLCTLRACNTNDAVEMQCYPRQKQVDCMRATNPIAGQRCASVREEHKKSRSSFVILCEIAM